MSFFSRNKEEDFEDEEEELGELEVKDLKPENRRRRKEIAKPWGKRERLTVFIFLLATVIISGLLAVSSRNWKLPGLPEVKFPAIGKINFDFLGGKTITIGSGKRKADPELLAKADKIKEEFNQRTRDFSGTYTFYLVDLTNSFSFGKNENEVMTAASLMKLPVIATIYSEAEKGKINLDAKPSGSSLTFRQLAEEMAKRSNNQAQLTAAAALGRDKIQQVIDGIGMQGTSSSRDETTAQDIGLFFQKLWNKEIVSETSRDEILNYLTDTIYENWFKKGIPQVRVAHKYGREVHVISDAGLVFAQKPFVLVVMSQGVVDVQADAFIPEFAAFVFKEWGVGF